MRPDRGLTSPLMVRSRVVLPAPLAPRTAVMVPSSTLIETPSSARTAPYVVTTSSTESIVTCHSRAALDLLAEVGLEHLRVVADLVRCARRDQPAEVEHDDAVADLHDQVHVVLDEQDRHPLLERADQSGELVHLAA